MIKYKFGYDSHGNVIDIFTLSKTNKKDFGPFHCLSCERELVPVLGTKRKPHFRHKVTTDINCAPETYLHKLTKLKFIEVYEKCLNEGKPFNISFEMQRKCNYYESAFLHVCHLQPDFEQFDLTKYFTKFSLESRESSFIPDVLLESKKGDKLFFEVFVTHRSSLDKLASNYRVIELHVKSEEDVKILDSCTLKESDNVKFYNVQTTRTRKYCEGNCVDGIKPYLSQPVSYYCFVLYANGKSAMIYKDLEGITQMRNSQYITKVELLPHNLDKGTKYVQKVIESHEKRLSIKNCFLCRYHARNNWGEESIFCKFLKKRGNSNMASSCGAYRPDVKVYSQYKIDNLEDYP